MVWHTAACTTDSTDSRGSHRAVLSQTYNSTLPQHNCNCNCNYKQSYTEYKCKCFMSMFLALQPPAGGAVYNIHMVHTRKLLCDSSCTGWKKQACLWRAAVAACTRELLLRNPCQEYGGRAHVSCYLATPTSIHTSPCSNNQQPRSLHVAHTSCR